MLICVQCFFCVSALEILHYIRILSIIVWSPASSPLHFACSFGYAKLSVLCKFNVIVFISPLHIGFLHQTLLVKRQLNFEIIIIIATIMIIKQQLYGAYKILWHVQNMNIYNLHDEKNNNSTSFTRERNANDKNNMSYTHQQQQHQEK